LLEERGLNLDRIIEIVVDHNILRDRILGRARETGGSRADDTEATVSKRLAVYREQTAPVADYYQSRGVLKQVDGMGTVAEVAALIDENLRAGTDA
jgi:adenylate kinase